MSDAAHLGPPPGLRSASPGELERFGGRLAAHRALLAVLQQEQARRRHVKTSRFTKYVHDPEGFVRDPLKGFIWGKQREIALSVRDNRRTAVPSCHDVGKSAIAGRIGAWWISAHLPGEAYVVTLAPTYHQVRGILWRELNKIHGASDLPGRMNQTEWWIGNELVAFGRSPAETNPTAIQGIHALYVLVIFDEACGIAKSLWDAADSLVANDNSRFLAIGNPDDPNTEFCAVCRPGSGWNVIQIPYHVTPNFTDEEVPEWLRPLLISPTWVREKQKSWGVDSPMYKAKVLAEFPSQSTDSLVSLTALREARDRPLDPALPRELGIDVSRFGGDYTVAYLREGLVFRCVGRESNRDLMFVAGMVLRLIKETGATRCKIDDNGLGGGVTDRLREVELTDPGQLCGCQIVPVNVGSGPRGVGQLRPPTSADAADDPRNQLKFVNLRAELNWAARNLLESGRCAIQGDVEHVDLLLAQAGQVRYRYLSDGRLIIEDKAEMKKRTKGVSPDDWDAFVLAADDGGGVGEVVDIPRSAMVMSRMAVTRRRYR